MMNLKYVFFVFWALYALPLQAHAHGKEKYTYDANTTLFVHQSSIQHNTGTYAPISTDLDIRKLHRFTFVQHQGHLWQDLANHGTATRPLFYVFPEHIGLSAGFHIYDPYFRTAQQMRYYDTAAPYTRVNVNMAHFFKDFSDSFFDMCHAQNVTPNWNVGVNVKVMRTGGGRLDAGPGVVADALDLFTSYSTDDETYQLLSHAAFGKHKVQESAGMEWDGEANNAVMLADSMQLRVNGHPTPSLDVRKRLHLYQQKEVAPQLWIYNELCHQEQKNEFSDQEITERSQHAELGGKTAWRDLLLDGHYRYRYAKVTDKDPKANGQRRGEQYIGFRTRYALGALHGHLGLEGTYLLHDGLTMLPGLHKTTFQYTGNRFSCSLARSIYQPTYAQLKQSGELYATTATQVQAAYHWQYGEGYWRPKVSLTNVDRAIEPVSASLTDPQIQIQQATEATNLVKMQHDFRVLLGGHVYWDGEVTMAHMITPSEQKSSIPHWLLNMRLYYAKTNEKGNGTVESGVDLHWKSNYFPHGYDRATQQFFKQSQFQVDSYPVLDLFVNFRIKHLKMFLKFNHFNEYFFAPGYFVTPRYPASGKSFDVGVVWDFFE